MSDSQQPLTFPTACGQGEVTYMELLHGANFTHCASCWLIGEALDREDLAR